MFLLFDTNIWFSELGLKSPAGAAIRYFAKGRQATVVILHLFQPNPLRFRARIK